MGQAGVRTFPDIFENGEFFFFVLAFLPQGKRCWQAETQSFKNGLLSGDFFKTPAYRISFVISF